MPKRRKFEENKHYHVYNRWLRKQTLFHREEDFEKFMIYVDTYREKCKGKLDIIAFCVLPNHFHFIFHNKFDWHKISYFIGNICSAYARYYQTRYQMDKGRVYFENRFKCKEINDEEYLQQCICYVENNPIKHNIVDTVDKRLFRSASLPGVNTEDYSLDAELE